MVTILNQLIKFNRSANLNIDGVGNLLVDSELEGNESFILTKVRSIR